MKSIFDGRGIGLVRGIDVLSSSGAGLDVCFYI